MQGIHVYMDFMCYIRCKPCIGFLAAHCQLVVPFYLFSPMNGLLVKDIRCKQLFVMPSGYQACRAITCITFYQTSSVISICRLMATDSCITMPSGLQTPRHREILLVLFIRAQESSIRHHQLIYIRCKPCIGFLAAISLFTAQW